MKGKAFIMADASLPQQCWQALFDQSGTLACIRCNASIMESASSTLIESASSHLSLHLRSCC
eukprot:4522024-Pleurochrysis_carterae.AAC.1